MSALTVRRSLVLVTMVSIGVLMAGCSSTGLTRAPVEDRGLVGGKIDDPATLAPIKQLPGFENAGKPGYYTVKPGETLTKIGLDHGYSAKEIARWSNLENPNRIEIGQVLRVEPPATGVVVKPIANNTITPTQPGKPAATSSAVASTATEEEIGWIWPTNGGTVLAGFDEIKNKGLDISGTLGDPVLAAADGRVVYVGSGLRGYGNLIILKHNNTYLSAYAHNKTLLIKEDQSVRKGQRIAEMGNSDADRVKLHFEVRRQGKPVDPAKYLPTR